MEPNADSIAFGKRLADLRAARKLSQAEVGKALRIGQSTYAGYETGKRNATTSVIKTMSKFYNVSPEFLLNEPESIETVPVSQPPHYADLLDEYRAIVDATSEQVYKTQTIAFRASITAPQPDILPNNVITLRSSEQPFSAGHGVYLGPEAFDTICVERNELTEHADYAGPVEGDSMEPKYHDGDILLVSTKEYPERGEIGIFSLDGCGYVKKLGDNKLISLNPKYDPIPMDESIRCNGKVIGILDPDWIKGGNQ